MAKDFRVAKWAEFQHYKDRNPPWIKLHYELLSSRTWVSLDDASRVLAIACMLVASRNDGAVPNDPAYMQRVAYLNSPADFTALLDTGFLVYDADLLADASNLLAPASTMLADASTMLAPASTMLADASTMLADARPETETETETETEADKSARSASVCPLAGLPELQATFPKIDAVLREVQPRAKPLRHADRDALAKLHRIDGYPQREILQALHWLFRSQDADAVFWRAQVFALAPLRKAKDGATKFDRIHAAWKRAVAASDAQQEKNKPVDRIQQQTENRIRESLGLAKVS